MATSGKLRLPQSPRAAVFRTIVAQLRASVPLQQSKLVIRAWEGKAGDDLPWALNMAPGARLTPRGEAMQFMSPDAYLSRLTIGVEIAVAGTDLDDPENLHWLFVRALWPPARADRLALMDARKDAGAETGLIDFSGIDYAPGPKEAPSLLILSFSMSIAVRLVVNP